MSVSLAGVRRASAWLELSESRQDVILLESGGEQADPQIQDLNAGTSRGAPQWPLLNSRLRMLGGTTNHWSGSCRPLDEIDFEARSWVANSGWPISRAELDPYYARAHEICEIGPYDYGEKAWGDLISSLSPTS
jgi:choline dehydrogenase-like flavoprotein